MCNVLLNWATIVCEQVLCRALGMGFFSCSPPPDFPRELARSPESPKHCALGVIQKQGQNIMLIIILYVKCLFFSKQLRSEETVELQHIMEEISKMFSGRRRGTEWSVPWPYKGYCYCFCNFLFCFVVWFCSFLFGLHLLKRCDIDCSQSPIFSWDRLDIPNLTVTAILIFKCTEGVDVGDYSSP